jgi:quercetin dioxygenase-like cupin family protein/RimJ/RimL family protein N-acetyltransferase
MKIRLLTQEDWQAFKSLRLEALTQHPEAFGSSFEEESKLTDVALQQRFSNCDLFGAFIQDELIGCAGFFIYSSEKMAHRGCLFSMYTKNTHRNRGVAGTLIKAIIAHAKTRVVQLHTTVVTTNLTALRLYQNHGFHIYGTEPSALKVGENIYDEHLMVLVFSSNQSLQPILRQTIQSIQTAPHFTWGDACDCWWLHQDEKFTVIAERMPPNTAERRHYHQHADQFFYCLQGELWIQLHDEEYILQEHEGLSIPAGAPHQVKNNSSNTVRFLVFSSPNSHMDRIDLET